MSFEIGWTDAYPWWLKPLSYWRSLRARKNYGIRLGVRFTSLRNGLIRTGKKAGYQSLLHQLRNVHEGKRCFVIGNGCSLRGIDLSSLKDEITIGSNEVYRLFPRIGFHTSYLTVCDSVFSEEMRADLGRVRGPIKLFSLDTAHCLRAGRDVLFVDVFRRNGAGSLFSDDVSSVMHGGESATYLNLQLAFHFGCNPVYLVGTDFTFDGVEGLGNPGIVRLTEASARDLSETHSDPGFLRMGMRVSVPDTNRVEEEFRTAAEFYKTHGRRLVDITPGSGLDALEKGDYGEVLSCEDDGDSALAAFGIGGEHFEEVTRITDPRLRNNNSEKHYRKALRLCKEGSPELALAHLERSVKSRPHSLALYMRASLLKSLGRTDEAVERFEDILTDGKLHITREVFAGAHFHLGELLFRNGSYGEAKDHFLCCVEAIPLHKKASGYLRVISAEGCGVREDDLIELCTE